MLESLKTEKQRLPGQGTLSPMAAVAEHCPHGYVLLRVFILPSGSFFSAISFQWTSTIAQCCLQRDILIWWVCHLQITVYFYITTRVRGGRSGARWLWSISVWMELIMSIKALDTVAWVTLDAIVWPLVLLRPPSICLPLIPWPGLLECVLG